MSLATVFQSIRLADLPQDRLSRALAEAIRRITHGGPTKLSRAIEHAALTPASRRRPLLCLAVATALGEDCPELTDAACASIELIHCASLVHDDLPCFDDAPMRRGVESVHRAFGEGIAVLAGDALILGAFENLARAAPADPTRAASLMGILARAAGAPTGLVAGQAWESEPAVDLERYHHAKTASLFEASTMAGAVACGHAPEPWRALGTHIGHAYQVADDIGDAAGDPCKLGKPVGRDASLDRPSAVRKLGMRDALAAFARHRQAALEGIPLCEGRDALRELVQGAFDDLSTAWRSHEAAAEPR